jgi:hypothetical protein
MKSRTFVPGAIATPGAITLPADAPDIDAVVSAQIIRVGNALAIPDHTPASVVAAIANHAVHAHDLVSQGLGGAVANALGLPAGLNVLNDAGAAALHTVPGAGATGVQNNAAAQAHAATAVAVAHGAVIPANPVVAAVPTKVTGRTFSLDVNTLLGDLLTISFREMGERVATS